MFPCLLFLTSKAQDANRETIIFSNDGSMFACGYENAAVEVTDVTTGKRLFTIKGTKDKYPERAKSLSISPDKKYLAVAYGFAVAKVMDIASGKEVIALDRIEKVLFLNSGKLVTIKEKIVNVYSANSFSKEKSITLSDFISEDAAPCTLDATSEKIVVPLSYSDWTIIDVATDEVLITHKEDTKIKLESIQVSNDAGSVITCTEDKLKIFLIKTGETRFTMPVAGLGYTIPKACLTEEDMLYTGSMDGNDIRCIDIITGKLSERESLILGSGNRKGFYFAPRSPVCTISYAAPYKKKAQFAFVNVVTRKKIGTYLE